MKVVITFLFASLFFTTIAGAASISREVKKGDRFYKEGKYDEALANYDKALSKKPDDSIVQYNKGAVLYRKDDFPRAEEAFLSSLASGKESEKLEEKSVYNVANSKYRIGLVGEARNVKSALNSFREAVQYYKRAMELVPNDLDAKYNYEFVQKKIKELEKKEEEKKKEEKKEKQEQKQKQDQKDQQKQEKDKDQQKQDQQKNEQDQKKQDEQKQEQQKSQQDQQKKEQEKEQQQKDQRQKTEDQRPEEEKQKEQKEREKEEEKKKQEEREKEQEKKEQQEEQKEKERQQQEEEERKQKEQEAQQKEQEKQQEEQGKQQEGEEKKPEPQEQPEWQGGVPEQAPQQAPEAGQGEMTLDTVEMLLRSQEEEEGRMRIQEKKERHQKPPTVTKDW